MMKLVLAASALLVLTACDQSTKSGDAAAPEAPVAALPTQADVEAAFAKIDAAVKAKDAAALSALYAPGAVFVDPMENAVAATTPESMRAGADAWMKIEPSLTTVSKETQILDADTFVISGQETVDFKRNGRPTWVLQRFTQVWQKQADGQWLIATEHLSMAPKPVATRPAALAGAEPAPDTPPLGGSAPAPEKK